MQQAPNQFQQPTNNLQQVKNMMNLLRTSQNPQAMMQTLLMQNPQLQSVMTLINQSGGDPKTAFYKLAEQKGVDPNQIINMLK